MPHPTLTDHITRGLGIRTAGTALELLLTLGIGVLIARLLTPAEYGLFALALSVTIFFEHISGLGMLTALMQRKPLTAAHETAGLVISASTAMGLYVLVFAGAPLIEALLRTPDLAALLRWLGLALLSRGVATVPEALLYREMAFGRVTLIRLTEKTVWGTITLALILYGFGTWALVYGTLFGASVTMVLLWGTYPWTTPLHWDRQAAKDLLGFGTGSLLITLATTLSQRIDVLIVGRQLGPDAVGLYHRAAHLITLPLTAIVSPIHKVVFPALSQVQDDHNRLRRGYLATLRLAAIVAIPLMVGLAGLAPVLIPLVYGPQWAGSVPILQWLALAGICRVILAIHGMVIQATGRVQAQAILHWVWLGLMVVCGGLGSAVGVLGVVWGVIAATGIFCAGMTILALRATGLRWRDVLDSLATGMMVSTALYGVCYVRVWMAWASFPLLSQLLTLTALGALTYLVCLRLWMGSEDRRLISQVAQRLPGWGGPCLCWLLRVPYLLQTSPRRVA
jgi:O-antigen/teichoic acid export membrane protein